MLTLVESEDSIPFLNGFSLRASAETNQKALQSRRMAIERYREKMQKNPRWISMLSGLKPSKESDIFPSSFLKENLPETPAETLVFYNGFFRPEMSSFSVNKVHVSVQENISSCEGFETPFADLTQAYCEKAVTIVVEDTCRLRFVFLGNGKNKISFVFNKLYLKADTEVEEIYMAPSSHLMNVCLEVKLFESVCVTHSILTPTAVAIVGSHFISLASHSRYHFQGESLLSTRVILDQIITLKSHSNLLAQISSFSYQNLDLFSTVHVEGDDTNHLIQARVCGRNNTNARINVQSIVPSGTQNATVSQDLKGLFLEEGASFELIPNLLVSTEQAQAHHGASLEKISEADLFFLSARGIEKSVAEKMKIDAFCTFEKEKLCI